MVARELTSWRSAAVSASFSPHRPVDPAPDAVWLGGWGVGGAVADRLEICALVNGGLVEVDTMDRTDRSDNDAGLEQRNAIFGALFEHLVAEREELVLPVTIRVDPEDRAIAVDGAELEFRGFRIAGSPRWSGSCRIGSLVIRVTVIDPAVVLAIASTDGAGLDETPGEAVS